MSISIIGCGWLGLELGKELLNKHYKVRGSTTTEKKRIEISKIGIDASLLTINENSHLNYSKSDLFKSKTIIITLPFKRSFNPPTIYENQITILLNEIKKYNKNPSIIFTSSTSIYPKDIIVVSESTQLKRLTPRQKTLLNVENKIKSYTKNNIILRLGGLFGGSRKIGMFLRNKTILENSNSPVNLIHRKDVIAIIENLLSNNISNITLNCVCNHHPNKEDLYDFHAKRLNVPTPIFKDAKKPTKLVNSNLINKLLKYKFIYDNLFTDYD